MAGESDCPVETSRMGHGSAGLSGAGVRVMVLAATSRREAIDAALLRPGRLQESVMVPLPQPQDWAPIVEVATRGMPIAADACDLPSLVDQVRLLACRGAAGACACAQVDDTGHANHR
jgi:ATP-dependent 26S proteasome regulatory subunit